MTAAIKLKSLEGYLGDVKGFLKPKIQYEQYETPCHIAAVALYNIQTQFEDIESKTVLDAGCGPGMLSIGAALLGASSVTGLDIDPSALELFNDNINEMELSNVDGVLCDFLCTNVFRLHNFFDTVLMNPPFGTKNNAGMDLKFLKMGLELSSNSVYSLHKSSTRTHIQKKVKEWGVNGSVVAEVKYNLNASYKFHKQSSRDIAVDLWRLSHKEKS